MTPPSAYHRCLAVGMHFTEHSGALSEERLFTAKPSRWKRWLPVWLVPPLVLLAMALVNWVTR